MSTGLALAVQAAPAVVISPWAGVAIDRRQRKTILVTANLTGAAGVVNLLMATTPARASRGPRCGRSPTVVSDERDLASASALSAVSDSALRMIGPLAGTFLVARGRFDAVVIADALSYAACPGSWR